MPRSVRQLLIALAAVAALAGPAAAQVGRSTGELQLPQNIATSDIQRLEQTVDQINSELVTLRRRDRATARTLQTELTELDEEVTYLKVKLRKEGNVGRYELDDLRSRLDDVRSRARGEVASNTRTGGTSGTYPSQPTTSAEPGVLPAGTEIDVRMESGLSSATALVEDRFQATTVVDLRQDGRVIIPAGSVVRGVVTGVKKAGRIERKGSLTLSFDQVTINGRNYPMHGTVTQALESGGYKDDAEKIGGGAAVGGIIGGILGGLKGALAGILIGGGGVVAATEGADVELTPGTVLRVRLDSPLSVRGNFTRR